MYTPSFCCECGAKILRLRWQLWTSRKFCGKCARRLWKARWLAAFWIVVAFTGAGYVAGRYQRPTPPPLTIERRSDSPLSDKPEAKGTRGTAALQQTEPANVSRLVEEAVYRCGARTKKGTPCSRRVHGPVRCWQHRGLPAMEPQTKLKVE